MRRAVLGVIIVLLGGIALGQAAATVQETGNAVVAGQLAAVPTIRCIGLHWPIRGDADADATGSLRYREAGKGPWREALGLWRVAPKEVNIKESTVGGFKTYFIGGLPKWNKNMQKYLLRHYAANYLAGSIFNLKPGTAYEIEVTLTDPDGGGATRTVSVSTRPVPLLPEKGNEIHVRGGDDALKVALRAARAGDIFLVHAGKYDAPVMIEASGTPEKPIVVRNAGDGEAVIRGLVEKKNPKRWHWDDDRGDATDGITIRGSHVHLDGLRVRHCLIGIYCGTRRAPNFPTGVAITHCKVSDVFCGLYGRAGESYFADNTLKGDFHGGNEGEGIEVNGCANVLCYNQITHFADAISVYKGSSDCDVYNNNIIHHGDDALELDYGGPNTRVFDNRFSYTGANGISVQPYIGGPAYLVRNLVFNADENCIKDRYEASGVVMINNTFVSRGATRICYHTCARNNLFLTLQPGGPALAYHAKDLAWKSLDLDYNGYGGGLFAKTHVYTIEDIRRQLGAGEKNGWAQYRKPVPLADFQQLTKSVNLPQETHGITLATDETLRAPLPTRDEIQAIGSRWVGFPHPDLRLKEGSPAIDAGVVVPNITEIFEGKAPDLGALESGAPLPHWGPREEGSRSAK